MGKPTGFMEYKRENSKAKPVLERIRDYNEFHVPLSMEERKRQGARCMECGVPFCQSGMMIGGMTSGCPLHNLIPEWNDLIYHDSMDQAVQRLLKTNNFPEFTARVCPALCEAACTCNMITDPVSVKENEYAIIEYAYENGLMKANPPKVRTGKKAAVVGSGPSGLAAADQLNKRGHEVTVYERFDRAGGLLMYGIPNMKLQKEIIERRISLMKEEGIQFALNQDVGKNVKARELLTKYDSILLACGASNPRDIQVAGRDAKGIYFAVDFLRAVTKSLLDTGLKDGKYPSAKGKKVVIIGGGDTGNDCVAAAIRQGCKSAVQLEMMPRPPKERLESNPWPEWPRILKTDYGQEEAIAVFGQDPRIYQSTVKEFIKDNNGNLCKIVCTRLEQKEDKESGRMVMVPAEEGEFVLEADLVLIAAGFVGSQEYVARAFGVELNQRSNILTPENGYQTCVPRVFAAGDMRRGQSLVVWAIREGREAAKEMDAYLMGYTNL